MSPIFGANEQKCLKVAQEEMKPLNQFPNRHTFLESVEPVSKNRDPNVIQKRFMRFAADRKQQVASFPVDM